MSKRHLGMIGTQQPVEYFEDSRGNLRVQLLISEFYNVAPSTVSAQSE